MERRRQELGEQALVVARSQAGLMSLQQLCESGFSRYQIYSRSSAREWVRVARGVYDVMPREPWSDPHDIRRKQAAWLGLLAYPQGILTGLCALCLHGVWGLPQVITPEVALPGGGYRQGVKGCESADSAISKPTSSGGGRSPLR